MEDKECACGYNPFDSTDQCYCPYFTTKIRKVTPIPEDERTCKDVKTSITIDNMSLIAWLAEMDLLTPG